MRFFYNKSQKKLTAHMFFTFKNYKSKPVFVYLFSKITLTDNYYTEIEIFEIIRLRESWLK